MFKRLLKILLYISLSCTAIIFVSVFFALQSTPSVKTDNALNASTAKHSKAAIKRVLSAFNEGKNTTVVTLNVEDIESIAALVNRSVPNLKTALNLQPSVALASMSYALPLPKVVRYLNVEATLYSSNFGLAFGDINIGSLSFSGTWVMKVVKWAVNSFIQPELGDNVFSMVEWVTIHRHKILFNVKLPAELQDIKNNTKSSILALRDKFAVFGDVYKVKKYYVNINAISTSDPQVSLTTLISRLFTFAQSMSLHKNADEVAIENSAALTALAIYLGADRFEMLVGDIAHLTFEEKFIRDNLRKSLTLHQRVDLQKHFIYSVALQLFSSQGTSDAIGEMKEFIDSNKGGSGFSFVDLLADRTGTRFAKLATQPYSAKRFQARLTQLTHESELIPAFQGLIEGINKNTFEGKYKDIHSSEYKEVLADIDHRITSLALYR